MGGSYGLPGRWMMLTRLWPLENTCILATLEVIVKRNAVSFGTYIDSPAVKLVEESSS